MAGIGSLFIKIGSMFDAEGFKKAETGLKALDKKVQDNAKAFHAAGIAMTALGTAIVGGLAMSIKSAANFQEEMANVSTMLDKQTRQLLPKLGREVKKMAMEYGEATSTLSKGLYDILSAGVPATKAMDVLRASTIAAKAGMSNTGVAADALTTIINSYGLEASKAGDVSDWFFSIIKRGKTTFAELGPQVGQVASLAASAGLSMDEFGAAMATMTKSGVQTDIAITSLKGILTGFLKPTQEAIEASKDLGIELNTNTLRTQGLVPVLEKLSGATDEQVASIFGNVRALTGLTAILKDTNVYYEDLTAIQNRAGASQEAFKKQSATLSFQMKQLGLMVQILFVNIGEKLLPIVSKATQLIIEALKPIIEWTENNKELTKTITLLVGGLGALMLGLGPILLSIPALTSAFIALLPAIKAVFTLISAHPFIATAAGTQLLINAIHSLIKARIEDKNAAINMGKTTEDMIKQHKDELASIKEQIKNTKLSTAIQIELRQKYARTLKALKSQEEKLIKKTQKAELETVIETDAALTEEQLVMDEAKRELAQAYFDWEFEKGNISLEQKKLNLEQQLADVTDNEMQKLELKKQIRAVVIALEEQEDAEDLKRMAMKKQQRQDLYNATKSAITNLTEFQLVNIRNNLEDSLSAELKKYEDKKKWIEENVTDQTEKTRMLEELDRNYTNTQNKLRDDSSKEEQKRRNQLKPFLIAEALANTAIGVTKAFAQGGMLGFITGSLVAAAGAVQIATIRAQKFAAGVRNFVGGLAIVGEQGPELVSLPSGSNVYSNSESNRMLSSGGGGINIDLRGSIISSKKAYKEFEDSIFRTLKNNRKI